MSWLIAGRALQIGKYMTETLTIDQTIKAYKQAQRRGLEENLLSQIRAAGLPDPQREYRFDPNGRRWRFDFAWPAMKIACEVEGGRWGRGRHVRPQGFELDCIKYNSGVLLGWSVLRFTDDMVHSGMALVQLEKLIEVRHAAVGQGGVRHGTVG